MIKQIAIENFKSIKKMRLECSNLNLFVGTNSSGKSTIQQAILFFAQNMKKNCGLNGDLIKLGDLEENRCIYSDDKEIKVGFSDEEEAVLVLKLRRNNDTGFLQLATNYGKKFSNEYIEEKWKNCLHLGERKMQYLSCHRIGPKNLYDKNMNIDESIGINGEYAIAYLDAHGTDILPESLRKGFNDFTLLGQVNWWLKYIADVEVSTEEISGADMVRATYRMGEVSKIRPINIGSGISYLISVLIMCLSAPEGGILVLENPEIHLHPNAQSKVCEFLYFIADSGRQLFIETHSDHIFNGFRAGISRHEMQEDKVNIQYIWLNDDKMTEAMRVEIGAYGNIRNQKEGLFDQFDIDMNRMLGL